MRRQINRGQVGAELLARAADVSATSASLLVQMWNAHGRSLPTCKARLVPLSAELQRTLRRSAPKICQALWMSFPVGMLHSADLIDRMSHEPFLSVVRVLRDASEVRPAISKDAAPRG